MAHRTLLIVLLAACGGETTAEPAHGPIDAARPPAKPATWSNDEAHFGKFHSKRFFVTIPLPEGKTWKIDDRSNAALFAIQESTSSKLHVIATNEDELVNRQKCEERAKALGWIPNVPLTTVEQHVITGPEAYDSKVWVALDAGKPGSGLEGHVFLFGAFLRRCLLVHLQTKVASATDEEVLSDRLAVAEARIVRGITIDAPRTSEDAVPRDKPDIQR